MVNNNEEKKSSLDGTLDRMIDSSFGVVSGDKKHHENEPMFIPSKKWIGQKIGYFFGTSEEGTGYYRDLKKNGDHDNNNNNGKKRKLVAKDSNNNKKKGVVIAEEMNEVRIYDNNNKSTSRKKREQQKSSEELLMEAEELSSKEENVVIDITPKGVKQAKNNLQRIIDKNSLQRAQFADDASKFLDSEILLNDHITSFKSIAAYPGKLYDSLLEIDDNNNSFLKLISILLSHDNADISASVINVLVELIDPSLLSSTTTEDTIAEVSSNHPVAKLARSCIAKNKDEEEETNQILDLIIENLGRFNPLNDGDASAIEDILSFIENILDIDATIVGGLLLNDQSTSTSTTTTTPPPPPSLSVAATIVKSTKFLSWLIVQATSYIDTSQQEQNQYLSALQQRSAEIMSFILQNEDVHAYIKDFSQLVPYTSFFTSSSSHDDAKKVDRENSSKERIDGIELFLQSIAIYRKKHPSTPDEIEWLEHICLSLSSCLSFDTVDETNISVFLDKQGIELVLRCIKEKVHAGYSTLKLLDFRKTGPINQKANEHLVEAGGLKYMFPLFMGRTSSIPKPSPVSDAGKKMIKHDDNATKNSKKDKNRNNKIKHAKREWLRNIETNTIHIMYNLACHLKDSSPNDGRKRFLVKFIDDNYEKCDRLIELLLYYDKQTRQAEYNFFYKTATEDMKEDYVELASLDAKLKGGGDICHRLSFIVSYVCIESKRCHEHIISQLQLQKSGMSLIKEYLKEFAALLNDDDDQKVLIEEKYLLLI